MGATDDIKAAIEWAEKHSTPVTMDKFLEKLRKASGSRDAMYPLIFSVAYTFDWTWAAAEAYCKYLLENGY